MNWRRIERRNSWIAIAATLLGILQFSASRSHASELKLFVATNGNDNWSGRFVSPTKDGKDGPFQTIQAAQKAIRLDRHAHAISVEIRGGSYTLAQPLLFTSDDSGTLASPVTYEAYKNERPVISGGVRIAGMHVNALAQWEVQLPDVQSGVWNFEQLFVNGERRYRPRLPKTGYYAVAGPELSSPAAAGHGYDQFAYHPGEIDPSWHNIGDVEILDFHRWTMGRMRIAQIDDANHIIRLSGPTTTLDDWAKFDSGNRYLVENVKEALDSPGQFYLDRQSGLLTYIPQPGEEIAAADIVAPKLDQLLIIKGDQTNHNWVQYLTFRGLSFEYSNWITPQAGHDFAQAEVDVPAAIDATGARNCKFESCDVSHIGGYGISLGIACKDDTIERCQVIDLGAGGIMIGGQNIASDPDFVASNNTVTDCDICSGGRIHPAGVGVWIGQSYGNSVRNCAIHDLYYSGISMGWTWGYGTSLAHDNIVADNDIYQIGQGVLSDMGGIYTVGARSGTVETHNRLHDISGYSYGGWGIYFDEGTSDTLATQNLVYNTSASGLHQNSGANNTAQSNIFALGGEAQIRLSTPENHLSFTVTHNIILSDGAPILQGNWSGSQFALDYNDYWDISRHPITMDGHNFPDWQASGQDAHSILENPNFTDPQNGDFHITDHSTIDRIGFQLFDVDHFGPHTAFLDPILPPAFPLKLDSSVASHS